MFSDSLPERGHVFRLLAWARACFENPCLSVGMFSDSLPERGHVFRILAWAGACFQTPCLSAGMFSDSLPERGHVFRLLAWARACFQTPWWMPRCGHIFWCPACMGVFWITCLGTKATFILSPRMWWFASTENRIWPWLEVDYCWCTAVFMPCTVIAALLTSAVCMHWTVLAAVWG